MSAPSARVGLDWSVAAPLLVVHLLGLGLAPFTCSRAGLIACALGYLFTGFGVTAGAHRLFTHRSYTAHPLLRELLALAFLLSAQGSLRRWVRDHHIHHRFSDSDGDPHTPRAGGFLHAHLGWLWRRPPSAAETRALYDRYTRSLDGGRIAGFFRTSLRLAALHLAAVALAFACGLVLGGPRVGLSLVVWGVFVRMLLVMHSTFFVNSAAHLVGARPYNTGDDAGNVWWVAVVALGEGWHNNHHHRPVAANNGFHAWWQFDLTFLLLAALGAVGLVRDLKVYRPARGPGNPIEIWWPLVERMGR